MTTLALMGGARDCAAGQKPALPLSDASPRPRRYDDHPWWLNDGFAENCGSCSNFRAWRFFEAPLDPMTPAARQYVENLKRVSPADDANNAVIEGSYLGTILLADAMARVGADLTREGLRRALDSQTFETGLTPPLYFGAFPRRVGNRCLRSSQALYSGGSFDGWSPASGWVCT